MSNHSKPEIKTNKRKIWIPLAVAALVIVLMLVTVQLVSGESSKTANTGTEQTDQRALPVQVDVPEINASSSLIRTGLNPDGTIEVPPVEQPLQASWYDRYPIPGENGPAIILGHVNGAGQPGIFARLSELEVGSIVQITMENQQVLEFEVYRKQQVPKESFPTDEVYNMTDGPEIRVITCGGILDRAAASYKDNIIVYARLRAPPTES